MMNHVVISQILSILDGRYAGMAPPQLLTASLGGFICNKKENCFDPISGFSIMCDIIISQILPILDDR